jgi:hypothetical protein
MEILPTRIQIMKCHICNCDLDSGGCPNFDCKSKAKDLEADVGFLIRCIQAIDKRLNELEKKL